MREMTFEETKQVELEILSAIAEFCDANEIKYFIAYGTLIGAIRHKGFIPWDDDIDIWMPREDYNRFLESFTSKDGRYELVSPYSKKARHSFTKVIDTRTLKIEKGIDYSNGDMGVDVDIFPLDGQPENQKEFERFYNKKRFYYLLFNSAITKFSCGSWRYKLFKIATFWTRPFKVAFVKKCDKISAKYPYATSNIIGSTASLYNSKQNRYKKEWFGEGLDVVFENKQFKAPVNYHAVLTKMYGDYMQLPPEAQQVTHHSNDTFWKED